MLCVQTFGPLKVVLDGEDLPLPASRKTRALLAYLALTGTPQRRDRLCELLWENPDDPRGALRWSLSKLRPLANRDDVRRLEADRERIWLDPERVNVDFHLAQACATAEVIDPAAFATVWERASTLLLDDCELPNQPAFAAWLTHQRNEAARLRIKLARRLVQSGLLPSEDQETWADRWLLDAPFDPDAALAAVQARRATGREHEAALLAADLGSRFRAAELEVPDWSDTVAAGPAPMGDAGTDRSANPRQSIRFIRTADRISLAWASAGNPENPPLVKAANWLSHLELDWDAPIWSPLFGELARSYHFVRYDERGCGLSDWDVSEISFESFVTDLEAVVDAAGLERFPLLGISQGAAVSIEYAARHPERVSHLILFGGYPAGWRHTADEEEVQEREAVMVLTGQGWGRDNPSYRHLFSRTFMPDATPEELSWFDEFQRQTTSPANAIRFLSAFADIDVRERLAQVRAPTLVVHSRNEIRIPVETGRALAAQMPNAEFVGLESNNHLLLGREPASEEFIAAVHRFLSA